jgi:pimeloyl-ACP methyl ester carboxylesterase
MRSVGLFCALLLQACLAWAGGMVAGEPQSFVFTDKGHFANKPITVHYYKARSAGPDAKVMVVIHGMERQGSRMRDNWMPYAEKNKLIVLAPEFDDARFSSRIFNMGGIETPDRSKWSFQIVEHLFDFVRADENLSTPDYLLFGHSAGGQFVHRFMLLTEAPRVSVAVAANAGSYTMPRYPGVMDDKFPYALDEGIVSPDKLKQVFSRKLIVLLGEADTQTDGANLPKARQATAQGVNRFERGSNFFAQAQAQAQKLGTPLAWDRATVPGVGHDSRRMSQAAARLLFEPAK